MTVILFACSSLSERLLLGVRAMQNPQAGLSIEVGKVECSSLKWPKRHWSYVDSKRIINKWAALARKSI